MSHQDQVLAAHAHDKGQARVVDGGRFEKDRHVVVPGDSVPVGRGMCDADERAPIAAV